MLCASLGGSGVWERMDTYICMAESFCCSPETITTLLISYNPIQNKKFKVWGEKNLLVINNIRNCDTVWLGQLIAYLEKDKTKISTVYHSQK